MTSPNSPAPTRLTARTPVDLLAMVPVALGFQPQESVVLLTFAADRPFHARLDLPDVAADDEAMVETLLAPARRHRVRRAALVVYASPARTGDARRFGERLLRAFRSAGIDLVDVVLADGVRWRALLDPGEPGVPYDLSSHPFTARAVLDGRPLLGSREELAQGQETDPAAAAAVAEHLAGAAPASADEVAELVAAHLGTGRFPDDHLARVLRAIRVPAVRDGAWSGVRRADALQYVRLWSDAVRRAPEQVRGSAAAVLALAAWVAGDGALAWCAIDRCVEVDPANSLADLVADALHQAVPPQAIEELRTSLRAG